MMKKIQSSLLLFLATLIWGSSFVPQSLGMDHVEPFTFQAVRCGMAVIGLLPVIWLFDRKKDDGKTFWGRFLDKKLWIAGICCAIPLFLAVNLQQLGIVSTDTGKSAFLTAMYIVFVPILGLFVGKKPSIIVIPSVILAVAGLYFLSCMGVTTVSMGDLLLLGCAVAFAVQILFVDKFVAEVDSLRLNCLQALICSIASAIVMFTIESPSFEGISGAWWSMCYSGFLSMGAAYSLQIVGQKHLEPSLASLIMSMESVIAVLCGCILLREVLTVWETIGCILVFAAVLLSQLPVPLKKKRKTAA